MGLKRYMGTGLGGSEINPWCYVRSRCERRPKHGPVTHDVPRDGKSHALVIGFFHEKQEQTAVAPPSHGLVVRERLFTNPTVQRLRSILVLLAESSAAPLHGTSLLCATVALPFCRVWKLHISLACTSIRAKSNHDSGRVPPSRIRLLRCCMSHTRISTMNTCELHECTSCTQLNVVCALIHVCRQLAEFAKGGGLGTATGALCLVTRSTQPVGVATLQRCK
jgi:hypothetical protein